MDLCKCPLISLKIIARCLYIKGLRGGIIVWCPLPATLKILDPLLIIDQLENAPLNVFLFQKLVS